MTPLKPSDGTSRRVDGGRLRVHCGAHSGPENGWVALQAPWGVMSVRVLLVTGPVGVGKTTVALEASDLLEAAGVPHAVIDVDALSWCYPTPVNDPLTIVSLCAT